MEHDLDLGHLTQNEKDVFYAMQLVISAKDGIARSEDIKTMNYPKALHNPPFTEV